MVAAAFSGMARVSHMIGYNVSLEFWLDILEEFSKANTRLLVVSGFAASIRHQIPKLHLIHPRRNLSGLSIRVLATPMMFPQFSTPGWPLPPHKKERNYDDNLDRLLRSFEWNSSVNTVALLGCGPIGLPLARHAKSRGLSAIYVGGLIQILFGITGLRYVERLTNGKEEGGLANKVLSGNVNAHWMPPLDSETPPNFNDQEGGAYW